MWAQRQAVEYMGLLGYLDDLEMKVKHLQNHVAFLRKGGIHQDEKPLPDCNCLVCIAEREILEKTSISQESKSLGSVAQPEPSEVSQEPPAEKILPLAEQTKLPEECEEPQAEPVEEVS